jgi:hypothetical protein
MKSCPTCNRTYADDTFTFCLDDGALLSASYDPHGTLKISAERQTAPPQTEILHAPASANERSSRFDATLQDPRTLAYGAEAGRSQSTGRRALKYWFIAGGVVAFAVVGLAIAIGYMAWQANETKVSNSSKSDSTSQANGDVAVKKNEAASEANNTDDKSLKWLDGVWEGKGYQDKPKSTWSIKLTAQSDAYMIEYPSLACKGKWNLIESGTGKAKFKEIITEGLARCENNGLVLVERINDAQVSFKYSSPNATSVTSTAVLRKRL